jgi:N-acyl-D-amino-acid deacylase
VGDVDLVIRGGWLCDGSVAGGLGDVAVSNGRIAVIGRNLDRARVTINAEGCLVTPGFIDIHTHSDFTLPIRPSADAKLLQGVTTDVTGNCGFSPFPLSDGTGRAFGGFFEPELTERWQDLRSFSDALSDAQPAINVAPLVGLGSIRLQVVGEERRRATVREIREMRRLLQQALTDGAWGASTGLVYPPGSYADANEIVGVLEPLKGGRGLYATHLRNEGSALEAAVDEAISIGTRVGCPVQLSHHKCVGRANWGKVAKTLATIDAANQSGGDIAIDVYPYTAGSSTLSSLLPDEAWDGGSDAFRSCVSDPNYRASLLRHLNGHALYDLDDVILANVPSTPGVRGRRVSEVATERDLAPNELVLQLLERDGTGVVMVAFGMNEADLCQVLTHPNASVGSDGWIMTADATAYAHPRNFGCTVRLLAKYARDESVLSISEAVRKLTSGPAARLGMTDRGRLAEGLVADLVVFRLSALEERSDFVSPCHYPVGVEHVIIGGRQVVAHGELTGLRSGRVLRPLTTPSRA